MEVTKSSIAAEFCDMARKATGNSQESRDAQLFFKTRLIGFTDPKFLENIPRLTAEEREKFQAACHDGVASVIRSLTGAEFQMAVGFETMMQLVPKHEKGIELVLWKVALSASIAEARGKAAPKAAP